MDKRKKQLVWILLTGLIIGGIAVALVAFGNPKNMGFCIACFVRDIAGSVGMHQAGAVQVFRPEVVGIILGAFGMALARKEFKPTGGSSPMTRFVLGFFVMVGALMFLGCPLRMVLRIAGGDLNAVVGLVGFALGILLGIFFLNKGFSLGRAHEQTKPEGAAMPTISAVLLLLFLFVPSLFIFSESGPGSMSAPVILTLIAGLIVGALGQKTRLCMVGGMRDAVLFKDYYLLLGFAGILVAGIVGNLITGNFNLGFADQPVAHTDWLWNILGMALVGFGSVLLGGCPLRQLVLAGSGNSDSGVTLLGLLIGAAFCHNFGLASSTAGPTLNGQIAVVIGFVVCGAIAVLNVRKQQG